MMLMKSNSITLVRSFIFLFIRTLVTSKALNREESRTHVLKIEF